MKTLDESIIRVREISGMLEAAMDLGGAAQALAALEWVRDRGGLDAVREQRRESIPRAAYERKKAGWLDRIEECEEALARRNRRIAELRRERDKLRDEAAWAESLSEILDEWADLLGFPEQKGDPGKITARVGAVLDGTWRRLMPSGMEWPRFEDGEPVRIGDEFAEHDGCKNVVDSIEIGYCWYRVHGFDGASCLYSRGEAVKRPAPPVLDADVVEIRVGDALYSIETGGSVTVDIIEPGNPWFVTTGGTLQHCAKFTHRAPVLAADGEPLREGEHVYHVETGAELVVKELPKPVEYQAVVVFAPPASHLTSFDPDQLTHQRPVLDADGNRIEPGMDVWWVCEGDERGIHAEKLHVDSIGDDGLVTCDPYNGGTWAELEPSELYVNKPVLAADGKPLEAGQIVWHEDGTELRVLGFKHEEDGERIVSVKYMDGPTNWSEVRSLSLTHHRPDSFSLIEQDAELTPYDYAMKYGKPDGVSNGKFQRVDLVRRARALAGRDAS